MFTEVQSTDSQDYLYVYEWVSTGMSYETRKSMRYIESVEEMAGMS